MLNVLVARYWDSAVAALRHRGGATEDHWTARLSVAGIAGCLLLQIHLIFVQPINWDETRFLADVHSYGREELSGTLLTFHVHIFGWLTGLGNEIAQIRAGRLVMLALEIGTMFFIWKISRRLFDPAVALFATLGYISFSFVLQHGASFRFDPIVTFLTMGAIVMLLRDRLNWPAMVVVGLALAFAFMISIKTALILPLVVAVGAFRLADRDRRRDIFPKLLGAAACSMLFLVLLYAWHASTLADASSSDAQQGLAVSFAKVLVDIPFFPRSQYFLRSVMENPIHWLLLLVGIAAAVGRVRADRRSALFLLAFLLPLLTIAFYRNAFPYYYATVLAPAAVLFGAAASRNEFRRILGPVALLLSVGAIFHHRLALSESATHQQRTVEAVHAMFTRPVSYLDRCSMIASFPQAGMFLSSWGMENYRRVGKPVVRELLARAQPRFVIANSPFLTEALTGQSAVEMSAGFVDEDKAALRSNYVHRWGPVWVAGKTILATPAGMAAEFPVGGNYVLESNKPIQFDGRWVSPGQIVRISPGPHQVAVRDGRQHVRLRIATGTPPSDDRVPVELTFGRF